MRAKNAFWVWLVVTTSGSVVQAHVSLDAPPSRYYLSSSKQADQNKLKASPCGASGDARTTNASLVTTFKPGETIIVTWRETVQHPGHFRIAFDNDGQDFPFPGDPLPSGVVVLVDNIADKSGANGLSYSQQVTLPNVECNNCTLQLIQVMTTASPPYSKSGDLYFNCADLVLKAAGGSSGTGGAASGGTTGNTSSQSVGGTSARGGTNAGGTASSGTGANGGRGTLALGGNSALGGTNAATSTLASNGGASSLGGSSLGGTTSNSASSGGATRTSITLSGGTSTSNASSGGSASGGAASGGTNESGTATATSSSSTHNTTPANGGAPNTTSGTGSANDSSNNHSSIGGGTMVLDGTQNGSQNETDAPSGCTCQLSDNGHTGRAPAWLGLGLLWLMRRRPRRRAVTN
ncbi:MAG TPA: SCE4755 family polysaccharide monooxygenase-like protein [Polyangiaceae bacterium]